MLGRQKIQATPTPRWLHQIPNLKNEGTAKGGKMILRGLPKPSFPMIILYSSLAIVILTTVTLLGGAALDLS